MKKRGLRLGKKLREANQMLQDAVKRRQKKLEKSLTFAGVNAPAPRKRKR